MQDSRDEAVRAYKRWGLAISRDLNVPEDHLAFELEFMGRLSELIADALESGETAREAMEAQTAFIDEHLLNWVPGLLDRVRAFACTPFYPAITQVTLSYIEENRAVLGEVLA